LYGISQEDSTLIANTDLQKAAAQIEDGKGCRIELVYQVQRLTVKDSVIRAQGLKIFDLNQLNKTIAQEAALYQSDNAIYIDQTRKIKRRNTTILILAAGIVAAIIL
jgi:hypothetical protein